MNIPAPLAAAVPPAAARKKTADQAGSAAAFGDTFLAEVAASPALDGTQPAENSKAGSKAGKDDAAEAPAAPEVPLPAFPQLQALPQAQMPAGATAAPLGTATLRATERAAGTLPATAAAVAATQPAAAVPAAVAATPAEETTAPAAKPVLAPVPVQAAAAPATAGPEAEPRATAAAALGTAGPAPAAATTPQQDNDSRKDRASQPGPATGVDPAAVSVAQTAGPAIPAPDAISAASAPDQPAAAPGAPAAGQPTDAHRRGAAEPVTVVSAEDLAGPAAPQLAQVTAATPAAPATPSQATVPVHAPVPVPAGFTAQIARPVFTIARAGEGEHTMTVHVNPENLGPVTVQAHISAGNVRIELTAASSDGRDVLRQILPDLKRDLAGTGSNATLDLSSGSQSGYQQGSPDRENFTRRAQTAYPGTPGGRQSPMGEQRPQARSGLYGSDTTLDVMA